MGYGFEGFGSKVWSWEGDNHHGMPLIELVFPTCSSEVTFSGFLFLRDLFS